MQETLSPSLSVWNTQCNIPKATPCKKPIFPFCLWPEIVRKDRKFTRFLEIAIHQEIHFVTGYAHLSPTSIWWGLREVWSTLCSKGKKRTGFVLSQFSIKSAIKIELEIDKIFKEPLHPNVRNPLNVENQVFKLYCTFYYN